MARGAAQLAAVSLILSKSIHTPFLLRTPAMSDGEASVKCPDREGGGEHTEWPCSSGAPEGLLTQKLNRSPGPLPTISTLSSEPRAVLPNRTTCADGPALSCGA